VDHLGNGEVAQEGREDLYVAQEDHQGQVRSETLEGPAQPRPDQTSFHSRRLISQEGLGFETRP
jgi:hypothetical protein